MSILASKKSLNFFLTLSFLSVLLYLLQTKPSLINGNDVHKKNYSVLIVFSVSPDKCPFSIGDKIYNESLMNKYQYAKLKGYDVLFNRRQPYKDISGNYNKISILHEIVVNSSRTGRHYEWIFWLDYDAIINVMSFDIPFERYKKANIIVDGQPRIKFDGLSLNAGVFILRNCDWTRQLLELWLSYGYNGGLARENELKSLKNYDRYLFEQNALVHIFNTHPEIMRKTFFENTFRLNGYWKTIYDFSVPNTFIIHFAGCQFCWATPKPGCIEVWNMYLNSSLQYYSKEAKRLGIV